MKRQLYSAPFALRKAVCNKGQMHDLKQLYGEPISCTKGSRQYLKMCSMFVMLVMFPLRGGVHPRIMTLHVGSRIHASYNNIIVALVNSPCWVQNSCFFIRILLLL